MKINALLVDLRSCVRRLVVLPGAGRGPDARARDRLHHRLDRRSAGQGPAARRRRLDRQAVSSRGGDGADRGGRAPPPPRQRQADRGPLVVGELEIRADQFQAYIAGRGLDLTRREFELLQILSDSAGSVIERGEIYQRVWGYEMAHGDRSVDVFVRKLRSKIQKRSPEMVLHPHPLRRSATASRPSRRGARTPNHGLAAGRARRGRGGRRGARLQRLIAARSHPFHTLTTAT